ncbi:MAG: WD40 repeat domain-containing protein [Candidatus Poseidoniales archaeon]
MLLLTPMASATPTGLTYMDSTWSSYDADDGSLVTINPNNTILASVHNDKVVLFDVDTLEKLANFTFDKVSAIEFSPDGASLVVNKGSNILVKESLRLIDIESLSVLEHNALADYRAADIAWSPDSEVIAAPGPESGDIELYRKNDLSIKATLHGVHNVDISCIDYSSDGRYLVTGDVSGRYAIWNSNGSLEGEYRQYSEDLIDCKFTPDGADIILLDSEGDLMSRTVEGSVNNLTNVDGAKEVSFSGLQTGFKMHITSESDDFRGLLTFDYQTFGEIKRTTFFHNVDDLAFIDDDFGRLQALYVAAGTGQIAVYLRESIPNGFNQPGSDLDGDSVPDNLDNDDDGDGIIDSWDDDIGCDAPEGTPCSRYPQLSKIRQIGIDIGDQFTISDSITLPTTYSSHIRNLSRNAIASDQIISAHEAQLFADAMCANIDQSDNIEQWRESISLSNGELGDATVHCVLNSGMEYIQIIDSTTQISLTIVTTFSYDSAVSLPLDVYLKEQPLPIDGSIAWLAPAHPLALSFTGDDVVPQDIPLWWNDGGEAGATLSMVIEPEASTFEIIISWAIHPVALIIYLGILASLVLFLIRRDNEIEFDLDHESDEEIDDEEPLEEEDVVAELQEQIHDKAPSKRVTATKKREMYATSTKQAPLVKRRNTKKPSIKIDEPIVKTKRKRLESNVIDDPVITKRKVVVAVEASVKTRRVRKPETEELQSEDITEVVSSEQTTEVEPIVEKKKRKPVRRKNKSSSNDKNMDETKLQEDLVSDFLSED